MHARRTITTTTATAFALLLGLGLAACGGDDQETADTTVAEAAAAETTVAEAAAVETTAATPAAVETTAATGAASETTAATPAAVETTAATGAASETTASADPTGSGDLVEQGLIQALTGMGMPDPKAATACILKESPDLSLETLVSPQGPSAALLRGLIRCAGDELAAQSIATMTATGATDEQKKCAAKATFNVLADQDDAQLVELMTKSPGQLPDDIRREVVKRASTCGLSESQIKELLKG